MTLKELLVDWEDYDIASYYLACSLGIMKYDPSFAIFRFVKGVFMTRTDLGTMLAEMLDELAKQGILERNSEDDCQFRWNKSFTGYWDRFEDELQINSH